MFGLGNKTYEHFNAMGKFVDTKLEELGGERVFEVGMGDDDGKWVIIGSNTETLEAGWTACIENAQIQKGTKVTHV